MSASITYPCDKTVMQQCKGLESIVDVTARIVSIKASVFVTFSANSTPVAVRTSSLKYQRTDGPCATGMNVQISPDDFSTCAGIDFIVADTDQIEIIFLSLLNQNATYKIRLGNSIEGLSGEKLTQGYTSEQGFTTANSADVTDPDLAASNPTSPSEGQTQVIVEPLTGGYVEFSENVNASTLTYQMTSGACESDKNILISGDNFATCLGFTGVTTTATRINFGVADGLRFSTSYKFKVKGGFSGVKDLAGNYRSSDFISNVGFLTGSWAAGTPVVSGGSGVNVIQWPNPDTNTVFGFNIYANGTKINGLPIRNQYYFHGGIANNQNVSYIVRSVNRGGAESTSSPSSAYTHILANALPSAISVNTTSGTAQTLIESIASSQRYTASESYWYRVFLAANQNYKLSIASKGIGNNGSSNPFTPLCEFYAADASTLLGTSNLVGYVKIKPGANAWYYLKCFDAAKDSGGNPTLSLRDQFGAADVAIEKIEYWYDFFVNAIENTPTRLARNGRLRGNYKIENAGFDTSAVSYDVTISFTDIPTGSSSNEVSLNTTNYTPLVTGITNRPFDLDISGTTFPSYPAQAYLYPKVAISPIFTGGETAEINDFANSATAQGATNSTVYLIDVGLTTNKSTYVGTLDDIRVTLSDWGRNTTAAVDTVTMHVTSTSNPTGEDITLTEASANSGVFEGSFSLETVNIPANQKLYVNLATETINLTVSGSPTYNHSVTYHTPTILARENFDGGRINWATAFGMTGDWIAGNPSKGVSSCKSGNCLCTKLTTNYSDLNAFSHALAPSGVSLTGNTKYYLSFDLWLNSETGHDFFEVYADIGGGQTALAGTKTWGDFSAAGWQHVLVDISASAGNSMVPRFSFFADTSGNTDGACVDNIEIWAH